MQAPFIPEFPVFKVPERRGHCSMATELQIKTDCVMIMICVSFNA